MHSSENLSYLELKECCIEGLTGVTAMTAPGSRDCPDGMLEAGYPLLASRGVPKWTDSGSSARSNGYPFKRYPVLARPNGTGGDSLNSLDKEENIIDGSKGSGQPPGKGRSAWRGSKSDGENGTAKSKSCLYSILISVVVCCFFAEALLQGSVMMLWKQTDFSLGMGYVKPSSSDGSDGPEAYSLEYKLRFLPSKFNQRVFRQKKSGTAVRMIKQDYLRAPRIALVCMNLAYGYESLYLVTIAKGLQSVGYNIQLFALEEGPMQTVWLNQGISVDLLHQNSSRLYVDWSKFEGVIINSLNAEPVVSSFMQEPFRTCIVVWIIFEDTLGKRLGFYEQRRFGHLMAEWKQVFQRADVVVFPDYTLPMIYTAMDTGNFFVIPGSPSDIWDAKSYMASHIRKEKRESLGLRSEDIALVIVGSPFTYKGVWREHAMIMQAVLPIVNQISQGNKENTVKLKLLFVGGNPVSNYGHVIQVMAHHMKLNDECVSYFSTDMDLTGLLWASDVVVYSSLRDEQAFPGVLIRAMALGRFIVAPNITIIQRMLIDGVGGWLYPAGDLRRLTELLTAAVSQYSTNQDTISASLSHVSQIIVSHVLEGYANILENILPFPSDAMLPKSISEIPNILRQDWQWDLLIEIDKSNSNKELLPSEDATGIVTELERLLNNTKNSAVQSQIDTKEDYDILTYADWEDEEATQMADDEEKREEEQIEERHELLRGSWEDVYKVVKKMERLKNELHERDDGELERTGQPLCIYEPYFGSGAWPFLHHNDPLYRGLSLLSKQRRAGFDDIDAASRLPLLNNSYYRDVLCEHGAFFSIANRIDRIHKNAWIGFQPWRAAGRKAALSLEAENNLKDAIRIAKHGDAVYFWSNFPDDSPHYQNQDFWSFCDMVNNNNCRSVFLNAFKQMYGLPTNWTTLPPMAVDGGKWSVLHCWAMPTTSFVEFVMFARLFVDALDSQNYAEHHDRGNCCLGISELEVKHCYCRLLELLVNVWAYHSARVMVYMDPLSGVMQEQHTLDARQGQMWVKFFDHSTLKGMDEDLAEEVDDEHLHSTRRLWPQTGEVFWQGVYERERRQHFFQRMEKKRKNRERLERIRSRYRQKPLAGG